MTSHVVPIALVVRATVNTLGMEQFGSSTYDCVPGTIAPVMETLIRVLKGTMMVLLLCLETSLLEGTWPHLQVPERCAAGDRTCKKIPFGSISR